MAEIPDKEKQRNNSISNLINKKKRKKEKKNYKER